jgi:hypothetical protein
MKKTYYLLLFVLILSATANAQTDWVTKNLDQKVSVKFPAEPEKVGATNGIDIYSSKGKDGVGYSANVIDLNVVANLDSTTLASMKDTQGFADQVAMGIASKMPNYTLGGVTMGKWKTYTSYSVSGSDNKTKGKLSILMIMIGSKMYTLTCVSPPDLATKNDEVFLGSVDLVKK